MDRKAIIVDAPDLPPEDCTFFITEACVADSEQVDYAIEGGETTEAPKNKKRDKMTTPVEEEIFEEV